MRWSVRCSGRLRIGKSNRHTSPFARRTRNFDLKQSNSDSGVRWSDQRHNHAALAPGIPTSVERFECMIEVVAIHARATVFNMDRVVFHPDVDVAHTGVSHSVGIRLPARDDSTLSVSTIIRASSR